MKKYYISILMIVILAATLILGGCSPSTTSASATNQKNTDPTSVAEASPTALPEVSTAPPTPNWTAVVENKIGHRNYIAGYLNEMFGITVGYSGEIHYTNDGGKTWPQAQNTSACRYSLDIVDENLAWCGGNGGNVRVTKDGGKTWSAVSDIMLEGKHSSIDFLDDKTGWIASTKKMASTKDGGETWTELVLPEGAVGVGALCLRTPDDGYLLSNNGFFFTTTDGGTTWSKHDLAFDQYDIVDVSGAVGLLTSDIAQADISFTDEKNGTMVFTGTKPETGRKTWCLTTTDGGETWESELLAPIDKFFTARVYLSADGKYLTLGTNGTQIVVLKRSE